MNVPDDLRDSLEHAGRRKAFDALSYSHQREYVEWIGKPSAPSPAPAASRRSSVNSACAGALVRVRSRGGAPPTRRAARRPPRPANNGSGFASRRPGTARAGRATTRWGCCRAAATGVPHTGQCEAGRTTDSCLGTRVITTLRNEPSAAPTTNATRTTRIVTPGARRVVGDELGGQRQPAPRPSSGSAGHAGSVGVGQPYDHWLASHDRDRRTRRTRRWPPAVGRTRPTRRRNREPSSTHPPSGPDDDGDGDDDDTTPSPVPARRPPGT